MASLRSVLITRNDIPEEGVIHLERKCKIEMYNESRPIPRDDLLRLIKDKDGLYCHVTEKINAELLDAAGPTLKVIGTFSVGYDHIDLEECRKRGVLVGYTPNVLTDAVAELTVGLLLATSRRLVEANKQITNGGWGNSTFAPLWMCGSNLANSTIGIVGLGRIGFGVAERLKAFKVKNILFSGNKPQVSAAEKLNAKFVPFEELLKLSDFVIVCASLNHNTHRMFNLEAFQKMKKTAIFINVSRGGLVNHEDLYTALTTGLIKAAGLDVMDPEPLPVDHMLTKLSNCVLLPHIGSATIETRNAMARLTAENILAGLDGRPLPCPL